MIKNVFKLFSAALVMTLAIKANAGILVEPYLGYEPSSELKLESLGVNIGGKTSGANLGVRVGYKLPLMLWAALDYSMMSGGKMKGDLIDAKVDRSNLYLDVGFDLPVLARVWLGYGIMNSQKYKYDGGTDLTLKNGSNIKLGLGFTMLPLVSLNLEYFMHDYKDYESAAGSGSTSGAWNTHKETGVMLGVSVPFNF